MAKTKQKTKAEHRAQLARDIASILANPETPAMLYNELGGCVTELANHVSFNTSVMIEAILTAYETREQIRKAERTGGARR